MIRPTATVNIKVKGLGGRPSAALAGTALSFGEVAVGAAADRAVAMRNTGPVELIAHSFATGSTEFRALSDTVRVPAGDSAAVSVRFTPAAQGARAASLTFKTDDPAHAVFTVNLAGSGQGTARTCDYSGDGRTDIVDALALILAQRARPTDPALDWDGDGRVGLGDVLALLLDIMHGGCPESGAALAGGARLEPGSLSAGELSYLRQVMEGLSPSSIREKRSALQAELDKLSGDAPSQLPQAFALAQNYPNPFNPTTTIAFVVPEEAAGRPVQLHIYDLRGRLVRALVDGPRAAGEHRVFWDGADEAGQPVPSGIYIYRMRADGQTFTRKMVLMK